MEAQGLVPGGVTSSKNAVHVYSPRSQDLLNGGTQKGRHHIMYSPKSDQDEYILIDGTGSMVKTTKVHFGPKSDGCTNSDGPSLRGRTRIRRTLSAKKKSGPANAWGSKTNSQVSSQRSSPHKSFPCSSSSSSSRSHSPGDRRGKKGADDYSDSFTSDSSASRSRSKGKPCDLHLKYSKNEKLLEWLKNKDEIHKAHKKQQRKERREKRKAEKLKIEEKEALKETSQKKVDEWMKMKKKEARLLQRGQRPSFLDKKSTLEELVVIDEMLDLREHGARIDPSQLPGVLRIIEEKPESEKKAEEEEKQERIELKAKRPSSARPPSAKNEGQGARRERGRPHSATNLPFGHSVSGKKGRYSEGAKLKVRIHKERVLKEQEEEKKKRKAYDDWLKSKRKSLLTKPPKNPNTKLKSSLKGIAEHDEGTTEDKLVAEVKGQDPPHVNHPADKGKHIIRGADSKARPKSCKQRVKLKRQPSLSEPIPSLQEKVPQPEESTGTPRPEIRKGEAYNAVKHEQKSWENFADHVWKQANEDEEEDVDNKSMSRPEPQGSDTPDDVQAQSTDNDDLTAATPQTDDVTTSTKNNREKLMAELEIPAPQPDIEKDNNNGGNGQTGDLQSNETVEGQPSESTVEPQSEAPTSVDPTVDPVRSPRSPRCPEPEVTEGATFLTAPE